VSGRDKDEMFLDALSHEIASEVFEDEGELQAALGPTRSKLRERLRNSAKKVVGRERRARLDQRTVEEPSRSARVKSQFEGLSRVELLVLARGRFGEGSVASVSHRGLEEVSTEDLRSALEDAALLEEPESSRDEE